MPTSFPAKLVIRKKSGELVKAALRSKTTITTPASAKVVRFDPHQLEHIQPFFQADRAAAVGMSHGNRSETTLGFTKWERLFLNFPTETENIQRLSLPVRIERLSMSSGNLELIGSVAVENLAFHKIITVRYTLDHWVTTSDVKAEFDAKEHRSKISDTHDHFGFNIELPDQANLEMKTLSLCAKYCVNGQEHWDNNNSANFCIGFKRMSKKHRASGPRLLLRTIPIAIPLSVIVERPANDSSPWFRPKRMGFSNQNSPAPLISRLDRPTLGSRHDLDVSLVAAGRPRAVIT